MRLLGVDPGLSGALALLSPDGVDLADMPIADGDIDCAGLGLVIARWKPDTAVVERVGSMPGQGVASTWKFGHSVGCVMGVLGALQIPVHRVSPTTWKRFFGLKAEKESSRALALRLHPDLAPLLDRKKDHGRAEALLLARWLDAAMKAGRAA